MRPSRRKLAALAFGALLTLLAASRARAQVVPPDRLSGYTLEYGISWNGIPAARARAALSSDLSATTQATHQMDVLTWTLPFLRWIWPARNTVHAAVASDLSSRQFAIFRRERRKEQSTSITFDPEAGLVHVVRQKANGNIKEVMRPLDDLRDPVSLLYALRELPATMGTTFSGNVIVSDDVYQVSVAVVDRGTMRLAGRQVPVVCVTPRAAKVEDDGTLTPMAKVETVRVWVTDDPLRLPVRMSARAFIGRVTMVLRRARPSLETLYAEIEAEAALLADATVPPAGGADTSG